MRRKIVPIREEDKQKSLSEIALSYVDNRDIARIGASVLKRQNKKEVREIEELVGSMTVPQITYLNLRASGAVTEKICSELNIPRISVMLWEEDDDLFKACLSIIKKMEANDAEEILWVQAKHNPMAKELLMFGLRARKKEYQEGASGTGINQTRVEISIGGVPLDVSANFKQAGSDPDL